MTEIIANSIQLHVAKYDIKSDQYLFLLLQRSENEIMYPGVWQCITGWIENNETAVSAALRELNEETSLVAKELWTIPYITSFFDPYKNRINFAPVFACTVDNNAEVVISHEHKDFKWVSYDECIRRLPVPSHKDGTVYFMNYILKSNSEHFKINLTEINI